MPEPMSVREMRLKLRRIDGELGEIASRIEEMRQGPAVRAGVTAERRAWLAVAAEPRSPFTHSTSRLPEPDAGKWEKAWSRLFSAMYWLGEVRRRVLSSEEVLARFDTAAEPLEPLRREQRRERRRRRA